MTAALIFALLFSGSLDEGQLFNQVGTVRGQLTIINHPELGKTPCAFCGFLLQATKCKQCLLYVKTDAEGRYEVTIGLGRWKIIMRDIPPEFSTLESRDMISPDQNHYIDVRSTLDATQFDIRVRIPKN